MRGGKSVSTAIALSCLVLTVPLSVFVLVPEEVSAYTLHDPIYINDNSDFTPANGVTGGSGTASDPWIIEGWEIDATSLDGLWITGTTVPFIIRDVYVHSGRGDSNDGILLRNVIDARVENVTSTNNFYGIRIAGSSNVTVEYGNYSNGNWNGMYVPSSADFTINQVNAHANGQSGIYLSNSFDGTLTNNTLDGGSGHGVMSFSSGRITCTNNTVFGNEDQGFFIRESSDFVIEGNEIHSNMYYGIYLDLSTSVTITGNTFNTDGVVIWGTDLAHYNSHTITPDNTVNGEPLLFYKDTDNIILDGIPIGQLIFANCTDVKAANLEIHNTDLGIEVAFTISATITSNNVSNNYYSISVDYSSDVNLIGNLASSNEASGIECISSTNLTLRYNNASNVPLWGLGFDGSANITIDYNEMYNDEIGILVPSGTNLTITRNNISSNPTYGIAFQDVVGAKVYHNNIIDDPTQALDDMADENSWDDSYPSGGNYWSDYGGVDQFNGPSQDVPGSDGIGDTPYVIDADSQDNYPFMSPYVYAPTPPSMPLGLNATPGDANVTLDWTEPVSDGDSPITNYRIYRGTTPGGEVFLTEIGTETTHLDLGLINGQTYYYTVSAVNGVGEGPQSDEASATPATFPSEPQNLRATPGDELATLSWDPPASDGGQPIINYRIFKGTTSGGETFLTQIGNTPTYLDLGLINGQTYYYTVSAINGLLKEGPQSSEANATPIRLPKPPTLMRADLSGAAHEDVTLTWSPSPDDGAGLNIVVGYQIFRNTTYDVNGLGYQYIGAVPNATMSFVDSLAGEGDPESYYYKVCAIDYLDRLNCTTGQASKFTRPLTEGIHLISIPLIQSDESTEVVLQTIGLDKAWTYVASDAVDPWKWYMPFKPYSSDLRKIDNGMGIWVSVTENSNLTVAGIVPLSYTVQLHAGWNLVGFPSQEKFYAVANLNAVNKLRVEGFDPSAPPYFLRVLQDFERLSTGYGIWIKVATSSSWVL